MEIGPKTKVSLGVALGAAIALIPAVLGYADLRGDVKAEQKATVEQAEKVAALEKLTAEVKTQNELLKQTIANEKATQVKAEAQNEKEHNAFLQALKDVASDVKAMRRRGSP